MTQEEKRLFAKGLWEQFKQKVVSEWDEKYKKRVGDVKDLHLIDAPFTFASFVRFDIIQQFKKYKLSEKEVVSVHTLERLFQKDGLTENTKFITLEMCARYINYKGWEDFIFRNEARLLPRVAPEEENSHDTIINSTTMPLPFSNTSEINSYSNEEGLVLLSERIKNCKVVLNTRIVGKDVQRPYYSSKASVWQEALQNYVQEGYQLREIVSPVWVEEAKKLTALDNNYKAVILDVHIHSILNFSILEFKNGMQEVWFGWIISSHKGLEQPCFQSTDQRLFHFFRNWFYDLFQSGEFVPPQ